jgi:hypothetical protein
MRLPHPNPLPEGEGVIKNQAGSRFLSFTLSRGERGVIKNQAGSRFLSFTLSPRERVGVRVLTYN